MKEHTTSAPAATIGIDIGDKTSHVAVIDCAGEWVESATIPTTTAAFSRAFANYEGARVALEVGTHSPWISRILKERGFEVIVANPRRVRLIAAADRKNDDIDAEVLARLGRLDPALLAPITHRERQAQQDLVLLGTRDGLVQARTKLINMARGHAKALGLRVPTCSADAFHKRAGEVLSDDEVPGITVVVETIEHLTTSIRELDRRIDLLATTRYPETKLLRQVAGVGPLTAMCFVLTIEDPTRFSSSRQVGAYLGLVPKQRDSGDRQPQLGISKRGDVMLRRLLVGSARYITGPFGPDTDLRTFGERLSAVGGRAGRNRAAIAVARKLAVLLHRLWVTGEVYQPAGYNPRAARLSTATDDLTAVRSSRTVATPTNAPAVV
jgi:transposase